jgi:hypothetical protein
MDDAIGIIGAGRLGEALARDAAGFLPIDMRGLVTGGSLQQAGGPLAGHNLVRMPAPWE